MTASIDATVAELCKLTHHMMRFKMSSKYWPNRCITTNRTKRN